MEFNKVLNAVPVYILVFFCGFLVVRGLIAFICDIQDRKLMRLQSKYEEYELRNKLIDEMNKYENNISYNNFYENLEELPKENKKNK